MNKSKLRTVATASEQRRLNEKASFSTAAADVEAMIQKQKIKSVRVSADDEVTEISPQAWERILELASTGGERKPDLEPQPMALDPRYNVLNEEKSRRLSAVLRSVGKLTPEFAKVLRLLGRGIGITIKGLS